MAASVIYHNRPPRPPRPVYKAQADERLRLFRFNVLFLRVCRVSRPVVPPVYASQSRNWQLTWAGGVAVHDEAVPCMHYPLPLTNGQLDQRCR